MASITEHFKNGTGSQATTFDFTFPYIKQTDIVVKVYESNAWVTKTKDTHYNFPTATSIQFLSGQVPASGTNNIHIYRDTSSDTVAATFYPGSAIRSSDLNDNFIQNLYVTQEVETIAATIDDKLAKSGGTMTGNLIMGEDQTIIFEGATDNTNETTLTVADPTADRTITLPNVTGNVVTTGDTGTVATAMIAGDAVTNAKIADNSIDSEHYVDGSIDTAHIADGQVTTAKIPDSAVTTGKLAADSVTTAKIADDAVTMAKLGSGTLPTDITVAGANLVDLTVATADIADNAVTMAKLNSGALPTDITVASANLVNGTIVADDLASDAVTTAKILDDNVTFAKLAAAGVDLSTETWSDSDTKIATTKAIDDRIISLVDDVGGFYAIANETSFPNANPDINNGAGTIVSIKALTSNLVSNGSGVATISNGNVANNATITIEGLANSTTYIAGNGMLVETSTTLHTYTFHRELASASNITSVANNIANVNIVAGDLTYAEDLGLVTESVTTETVGSDISTVATNINDINSFSDIYRVASSAPSSSLDEGDLWYDSTANILKYYNGTAWTNTTGLASLLDDQTPELYAALDCNDKNLTDVGTVSGTNLQIDFGTL